MTVEDKWQFVPDKICDNCDEDILEKDVIGIKILTGCPYCHYSFVE